MTVSVRKSVPSVSQLSNDICTPIL